jgi:hypothetical protein
VSGSGGFAVMRSSPKYRPSMRKVYVFSPNPESVAASNNIIARPLHDSTTGRQESSTILVKTNEGDTLLLHSGR